MEYLIRIIYKSGNVQEFWCKEFTITGNQRCEWQAVDDANKPILLGIDEIAAVWQVGMRKA